MRRFPFVRIALFLVGILTVAISYGFFTIYDLSQDIERTWQMFEESMKWEGDIVPSLVATVATVSEGKKQLIDSISVAWHGLMRFKSKKRLLEAYTMLHSTARQLIEIGAQNQELQNDREFRILVQDLKQASNRVDSLAMEYQVAVRSYNLIISMFPFNLIARAAGFAPEPEISTDFRHGKDKS